MVFSSLFFLYVFLPLNLLFYHLMPSMRTKNTVMMIFSLIFYAWGEPVYVFLLLAMAFADWILALYISAQPVRSAAAKRGVVLTCLVNLGLLGIFKYGTFFLENTHNLFGFPDSVVQIALPIGISFYTFQLLSYVVDVYRGEVRAQRSFPTLLLYVSLFHQCIAGPIVRYKDINAELLQRKASRADISYGVTRFTVGLAKKAVLANACGALADQLLVADSVGTAEALHTIAQRPVLALWVGAFAFMLQIYLDFSAYSDMAIGMGRMIGFHYRENFNYPYISLSITDFWRRWHISLSSFFRDYVYIPLGGNRCSAGRVVFNLFVVWFLTGFWHGASWNFMCWGLYYFAFLLLERAFLRRVLERVPHVFGHVYALIVVYFGWVLFKFTDFSVLGAVLSGMFGHTAAGVSSFEVLALVRSNLPILLISTLACTPVVPWLGRRLYEHSAHSGLAWGIYRTVVVAAPVLLLLLATMTLVGDSYNPFLYWKF